MNTKLTLNIDDAVIASAKVVASKRHVSLSKLVESFLQSLSIEEKTLEQNDSFSFEVAELKGIYRSFKDVNEKDILAKALREKYL